MLNLLKQFLSDVIKRPSLYLFVFIIIFSIDRHHRYESAPDKENGPFHSDVFEYYSFLPEYFFDFRQVPEQNFHTTKRTVGMAIMYMPGFFVGHWIAQYTGDVDDGYSPPYHWAIRWGSIIYCLIGLFFCRKNLLMFFSERITAISMACVFFGTNLFFYTYGSGEYPHAYLFCLNALFIYFSLKWIREDKPSFLLWLCLTGGMITLIRPTGILVFLFPLLYAVNGWKALVQRLKLIFRNDLVTFLSCVLFILPLAFQALVWKVYQGHYILYSYRDEGFFFNDPQIFNFLLSFRKGWLVYTPIMFFALAGMVLSRSRFREFFPFMICYFLLNVYILSSWWDWAYGGSFGCRVLVESYAFLVFPFATFVSWIWEFKIRPSSSKKLNQSEATLPEFRTLEGFKSFQLFTTTGSKINKTLQRNVIRGATLFVFYLLIQLNLFQTWQFKYGRIHYNGMNWETYKHVFLKEISTEEANYLKARYTEPDAEKMKKGERDQ